MMHDKNIKRPRSTSRKPISFNSHLVKQDPNLIAKANQYPRPELKKRCAYFAQALGLFNTLFILNL